MHVRMHVYIFMYTCICMYVCMHVHMYYVSMYVRMYICVHEYLCVRMHVCKYVCMYAGIYVCLCVCVCMYVLVYVYNIDPLIYVCLRPTPNNISDGYTFSSLCDLRVLSQVSSDEIHGRRKRSGPGYSLSLFVIPRIIIIPPLFHTHLSPPPKVRGADTSQ